MSTCAPTARQILEYSSLLKYGGKNLKSIKKVPILLKPNIYVIVWSLVIKMSTVSTEGTNYKFKVNEYNQMQVLLL